MEESTGPELDSSTINSRSSSSIQTEPITDISILIEKLSPILNEMKDSDEITGLPAMQKAFDSLETDYKHAKAVVDSQTVHSSPAKQIESLMQNLGRSLGLVLFASHEVPLSNKQKIETLCKEMMNVRFELSSEQSEFADETEQKTEYETEDETENETGEEVEDEIVEVETRILTIDDAISHIKYGNEEKIEDALLVLKGIIMDSTVSDDRIMDEDVVRVLSSRLSSCRGTDRLIIIQMLRTLALRSDQHKEKMKDLVFLSVLVKSLARDVEERREAVGLLLSLSDDGEVRRRIGRIQGCIIMLVAILNGDDEEVSHDARMMLNAMSNNTQHVLHMSEAGYFKPLIKYLKEGSEMSRVLMAAALSRLQLTDQNKASLADEGAIEPLVKMFNTGNLEAKLSSLNALQSISTLKQNIKRVIESGIVVPLLQLLFSVTSVLMTLREPASAILAKVAQSESILIKQDIAHQMLSLLNLSSPVVQNHLLEALNNIVSHPSASRVRRKMKENGAVRILLPFFSEKDALLRTGAIKLVHVLSKDDAQGEIMEQLGYPHVSVIAGIVSSSTAESERAAALGILSNLPLHDKKITEILKNANFLPLMVSLISLSSSNSISESIAGVLIRFTAPNDRKLQHYSSEHGVIPILIKLLSSTSETAKSKSALCLSQLSQNSVQLSKSRKLKWFCIPPPMDSYCQVHCCYCSIKGTFCLVKAGAIPPLVQILENSNRGSDEAVLTCISTLLQDEIWEGGCNYLVKMSGVSGIVKALATGSLKAQEKALWILERVFRVEAYREEFGECAQVVLIDLAQNGDPLLASAVAKVLAQLELLQVQSSYF